MFLPSHSHSNVLHWASQYPSVSQFERHPGAQVGIGHASQRFWAPLSDQNSSGHILQTKGNQDVVPNSSPHFF